ncbi:MAG: tetratricopeptide repeat protein, partial [Eudoraea sp.]|nr:tetratricopeptide repeat protein [Eudoraea sp.]
MKNKPINIRPWLEVVCCALFAILLFFPLGISAQSNAIDSLDQLLANQPVDSVRVKLLVEKSAKLYPISPDSAMEVAEEAIALATDLDYKEDLAYAYKNLGLAHYMKGDYEKVMEYWAKSLEIFEEIDFKLGISNLQNNIGAVYQTKGDDPNALDYFLRSVKNAEAIPDTLGIDISRAKAERLGSAYMNIGTVYANEEGNYDQALEAYTAALDIFRKIGYDRGIATAAINIGEFYILNDQPEKSLGHLEESLELFKELGMDYSLSLMLLGTASLDMKKEQLAEEYFRDAVKIAGEKQSKMEQSKAYVSLANLQLEKKRYDQAIQSYTNALDLAKITKVYREQEDAYEGMAKAYSELGDFKKAFEFQKLFEQTRDTIRKEDYAKTVGNLRFEHDTENKEKEIELLNAQNELSQVQIDRDAKAKIFLFITLGLFLAIIAGVIYQYIYTRKSNRQLAYERNKS